MKSWLRYILILIAILSAVINWYHMIYTADTIAPFYTDEIPNVQASTSFLSNGNYKNDAYDFVYSSGVAVTWPGAIGWFLGGNLLAARLGCTFFSWSLSLMLTICFLRREQYPLLLSVLTAIGLWTFMTTSPFAMPYWFGFMYNLGEFNSALLIGFALLLLPRHTKRGVFLLGLAVWHGKLMYILFVWAFIFGNTLAQKLSVWQTIKKLLGYFVIFMLPLFLWAGWIYLRTDITTIKEWLSGQFVWFFNMSRYHPGVSKESLSIDLLLKRFSSPDFEWVNYSLGNKMKDLLLSVGATGFTLISLFIHKKKNWPVSKRTKWLSFMAMISIGIYSIHYFFLHPFMWQRHFQPTLYTGFGLWVFWGVQWIKNMKWNLKPLFYVGLLCLLAVQFIAASKHPLLISTISYPRACTDFQSEQCTPFVGQNLMPSL